MSTSDDAFKTAPVRTEVRLTRCFETGMWMAEVYAYWTIESSEWCDYLGGSKGYDYTTRGEAAAAIAGIAEKWLAKYA